MPVQIGAGASCLLACMMSALIMMHAHPAGYICTYRCRIYSPNDKCKYTYLPIRRALVSLFLTSFSVEKWYD